MTKAVRRLVRIVALCAVFAVGYLAGTLSHPTAEAQMGDLGKQAMDKASESGGALGSAAKLGTSIKEMEDHVSGLQKNLDTLKQIKAALGG